MSTGDLPAMSANTRESYHYSPGMAASAASTPTSTIATAGAVVGRKQLLAGRWDDVSEWADNQKRIAAMANSERVVQIYVADLDQNLPLDKRLIWQSEPIFTDLTDNDLWFDMAVVITEKLGEHNKYRLTVRNKSIKDREQMLEEIRPRDLSVNFTNLAQFQKPNK